jgi:phosphohistidine phosphatase SixA
MISMTSRAPMLAVAFAVLACASAPLEQAPIVPADRGETIVYLVRHAEKATNDPVDPDLSVRGFARADSLASQLRDAGINVIITTNFLRTVETAAPLARARHITPEVVPVAGSTSAHIDSVVAAVRRHKGATILVVGHSNTIGRIVERLGGGKVGDICDNEYANLFILSMPRAKPTKLLVDSYGVSDPPGDGSCAAMRSR